MYGYRAEPGAVQLFRARWKEGEVSKALHDNLPLMLVLAWDSSLKIPYACRSS